MYLQEKLNLSQLFTIKSSTIFIITYALTAIILFANNTREVDYLFATGMILVTQCSCSMIGARLYNKHRITGLLLIILSIASSIGLITYIIISPMYPFGNSGMINISMIISLYLTAISVYLAVTFSMITLIKYSIYSSNRSLAYSTLLSLHVGISSIVLEVLLPDFFYINYFKKLSIISILTPITSLILLALTYYALHLKKQNENLPS